MRAGDGQPAVIANAPFLDDGTPMPTRYWLVDPVLREAVSRLESAGGVRQAEAAVRPDRWRRPTPATRRSGTRPDRPDTAGPARREGSGGTRQGVKCLHAHLAWWLAGARRPGRGVDGARRSA